MQIKFSALAVGIILSGAFIVPAFASYQIGGPVLQPTQITLDPLPQCTNVFQCNATFLVGDKVMFTGTLTDTNGRFVPDTKVTVYRLMALGPEPLASGITERDGTFKIKWPAQFFDVKAAGETFQQKLNEVLTIFAKFDGDDKYAASQSSKIVMTIMIKDMVTYMADDKALYKAGETALVFVNFIEARVDGSHLEYDNFIEPDSIKATYDGEPVELLEKKTGSSVFITPPLDVGHHQLVINPIKEGYNNYVGFITVQVSGFFGK